MATTVTRYVDKDSSGGDGTTAALSGANAAYASLQACITAEAAARADLVSRDEILRIVCGSAHANHTADSATTSTTVAGFTTDATRYVQIEAATPAAGVWDETNYRLVRTTTADGALLIALPFVRVIGLQMRNTQGDGSGNEAAFRISADVGASSDIRFDRCLFRGGRYTLRMDNRATVTMWNCAVYPGAVGAVLLNNAAAALTAYNCVFAGVTYGIRKISGTLVAKNSYASGTTAWPAGATLTTCAASDATGSADTLDNIAHSTDTFVNVTAGSENYHLAADSPLIDAGTDTSGEGAPLNFTTDADGDTRSGTWDIGIDEYVEAEPPAVGSRAGLLLGVG